MIFNHYSSDNFVLDKSKIYKLKRYYNLKPRGLWLSKGSDWELWCVKQEYGLNRLNVCNKVKINMKNILLIKDKDQLIDFSNEFKLEEEIFITNINWKNVRKIYDGIYIDLCHCIFDAYFWFCYWDVPSACIWNLSSVEYFGPENTAIEADHRLIDFQAAVNADVSNGQFINA
ncbi:MAG: hypothetical protein LBP92_10660 [Deltaproteobacteria bacterium]|jgi:hypothetical protein|nr:hypothetical protein [Deltaproteobacteria bacterium]